MEPTRREETETMLKALSIKRKLMLIIMLTSSIALLLACAAFVVFELFSFRQSMKDDLSSLAGMVANTSTAALAFNDESAAQEILNSLAEQSHIVRGCIYSRTGEILALYARDNQNFVPPAPQPSGFDS